MPAEPHAPADVVVRPFEPGDRPAIRRICFETGYMGEPVAWQWRDAESFAELFTAYYTDHEPESAFVAERRGRVEGYLLGCVDTRRATSEASVFFRVLVRRGIAFRPGTAGFVWRSFGDVLGDGLRRRLPPPEEHDERWPAHLHIDLLPSLRGLGVGSRLMRAWMDHLHARSVPGCHLRTLGENERAIAFFSANGFRSSGPPSLVPGLRSPRGARHHVQLMVRALAPQA